VVLTCLPGRSKGVGAGLWLVVTGALVLALPMFTRDPEAFTNRGYIWAVSLDAWSENPWVGNGSDWYQDIAGYHTDLGGYAFHGHNQLVQALVTGGVIYAVLLVVQMVVSSVCAVRDARRGSTFSASYLGVLFVTCYLEVSLTVVDGRLMVPMTALPLAFVLFRATEEAGTAHDERVGVHHRPRLRPAVAPTTGQWVSSPRPVGGRSA
jgi:O-antigen ligase